MKINWQFVRYTAENVVLILFLAFLIWCMFGVLRGVG